MKTIIFSTMEPHSNFEAKSVLKSMAFGKPQPGNNVRKQVDHTTISAGAKERQLT